MDRYHFSKEEQTILEGLQQPFAVYQFINKRVVTLVVSDGFCDLFGYEDRSKAYDEMDHDMYMDTHPDDVSRIANAAFRFAMNEGGYDVIYRSKTKKCSDYHIIHASGKHIDTDTGVRLAHVWYLDEGLYSDDGVSNQSKLNQLLSSALHEESILKSNQFDYLTGLPSMTYFFELAEIGKKAIERSGSRPVLLFLDLSGMKYFNSKHGFSEGDKLLQCFAKLLTKTFNNENCCHVGGDHFAVYCREDGLEDTLHKFFLKCREINGGESLPVRVGIYIYDSEEVAVSLACDRAKYACDELRNTFESGFKYFNKSLSDDAERRQYILSNIDRAMEENWIKVYYQPIVRAVGGSVCDEEALARWIDPVRGFLSPALFIPFLEEANIIYKLDLFMLEQVLEKMKSQMKRGFNVVPHSINFSRSDFESCDLVQEVRRRVDSAGINHKLITIEVTESAIGRNFDFMKEQIERFRQLGFPVWMDDFGSGYSSLDVLSSIRFDLIKFDMVFMRKFDEGDKRKIILTELMRMATSLGLDTVCEGVETAEQVRFLQEIGCLKLQGFYFERPIPYEQILERYEKGIQIGYENPAQSKYYDVMGRINLYDLSALTTNDKSAFHNIFNTLPMGIIEMKDGRLRIVRSNPSFRDFMLRFFEIDLLKNRSEFLESLGDTAASFVRFLDQCCRTGEREFYDDLMPDGSTVHSFARKITQDPVTGRSAIAVAVLSITDADEGTTYATIARLLASDYYNIYYVDLETDRFIEYSSPVGSDGLAMERHGENFFEAAIRDTHTRIYEEDREPFLTGFYKENILRELDKNGTSIRTYRLIDTGTPMYVSMKITRTRPDGNHLIFGISVIDSQVRRSIMSDTIQKEETAYARIMALSGGYLSLYTVDPQTNSYFEYSTTNEYKALGFDNAGEDFFREGVIHGKNYICDEDMPKFISSFTKENILAEIAEKGSYQIRCRVIRKEELVPVQIKAVSVRESTGEKLIVGLRLWKERKSLC